MTNQKLDAKETTAEKYDNSTWRNKSKDIGDRRVT